MALIKGILKNASGVRPNTKIILEAAKTTNSVIVFAPDQTIITDANGNYSFECNPSFYKVTIIQQGMQRENVGVIRVYSDSIDGSLNDFLTNLKEEDVTPAIIKELELLRDQAEASADRAEAAASNAADEFSQEFQDRFNTLAPIKWEPNTLINKNQSLQVFEHDGLFYLPNVKKLPFTTGATFNAGNWVLSELATKNTSVNVVDTVEALKTSQCSIGDVFKTRGGVTVGDNYQGTYLITGSNEYPRVALANGLFAKRLYDGDVIHVNDLDWGVKTGGWHMPPYTTAEYDTAFWNGKRFQLACELADDLGISRVVAPSGVMTMTYYDVPKAQLYIGRDTLYDEREFVYRAFSCTLFKITNLEIDFSNTSIQVIFDSDNRSPYDISMRGRPDQMPGYLFGLYWCENVTFKWSIENPTHGDVRCRSWINDNVNTENTCAVWVMLNNYNIDLGGGSHSGFTGDFITGESGYYCGVPFPFKDLHLLAKGGFNEDGTENDTYITNRRSPAIQIRYSDDPMQDFNIIDNKISIGVMGYVRYPFVRNENIGVLFFDADMKFIARNTVTLHDIIHCPDLVVYIRLEFYNDERTEEFVSYGDIDKYSGSLCIRTGTTRFVKIHDMIIQDNRRGGLSNLPHSTTVMNVDIFDSGLGKKMGDPATTEFTRYGINCEDNPSTNLVIDNVRSSASYVNGFLISSTNCAIRNCKVDTTIILRGDCITGMVENCQASSIAIPYVNINRQPVVPRIRLVGNRGFNGLPAIQSDPNSDHPSIDTKNELVMEAGNLYTSGVENRTDATISDTRGLTRVISSTIGGIYENITIEAYNGDFGDKYAAMDIRLCDRASDVKFLNLTSSPSTLPQACYLMNGNKNPYKNIHVHSGTSLELTRSYSVEPVYYENSLIEYCNDVYFQAQYKQSSPISSFTALYAKQPTLAQMPAGKQFFFEDCRFDGMYLALSAPTSETSSTQSHKLTNCMLNRGVYFNAGTGSRNLTLKFIGCTWTLEDLTDIMGSRSGNPAASDTYTVEFYACKFINTDTTPKNIRLCSLSTTNSPTIDSQAFGCTFVNCTNTDGITIIH